MMSPPWMAISATIRVELGAAYRIKGVAQQVRVGRGDQERGAGHDQSAQPCAEGQCDGQDHAGRDRKHELQHQQRSEVVAELLPVARRLASVERVEAQVGNDRHQRQVGNQRRVAPVLGVPKRVGKDDHDDQGHDARDHPGAKNEERIADGSPAELCCGAGSLLAHGEIVDVSSSVTFGCQDWFEL